MDPPRHSAAPLVLMDTLMFYFVSISIFKHLNLIFPHTAASRKDWLHYLSMCTREHGSAEINEIHYKKLQINPCICEARRKQLNIMT